MGFLNTPERNDAEKVWRNSFTLTHLSFITLKKEINEKISDGIKCANVMGRRKRGRGKEEGEGRFFSTAFQVRLESSSHHPLFYFPKRKLNLQKCFFCFLLFAFALITGTLHILSAFFPSPHPHFDPYLLS